MKKNFKSLAALGLAGLMLITYAPMVLAEGDNNRNSYGEITRPMPKNKTGIVEGIKTAIEDKKEEIQAKKEENQANFEAKQEQVQNKQQEVQANLDNKKQEMQQKREQIVAEHAVRLQTRFQAYYQRMAQIMEKMQSRYQTMSDNGKDMSQAQAKLSEAKVKLEYALAKGNETVGQFQAIQAENWETQSNASKELAVQARNAYREAVTLMQDSLKLAKQAPNR